MKTIIIIDETEDGLVTGEHRPYYLNEAGEKIVPSKTSAVAYIEKECGTNVLLLQAKIAKLEAEIESLR